MRRVHFFHFHKYFIGNKATTPTTATTFSLPSIHNCSIVSFWRFVSRKRSKLICRRGRSSDLSLHPCAFPTRSQWLNIARRINGDSQQRVCPGFSPGSLFTADYTAVRHLVDIGKVNPILSHTKIFLHVILNKSIYCLFMSGDIAFKRTFQQYVAHTFSQSLRGCKKSIEMHMYY